MNKSAPCCNDMARLISPLVLVLCYISFLSSAPGRGQSYGGSTANGNGTAMNDVTGGGGGGESDFSECVTTLSSEGNEGDQLNTSTAYTAAMCSLLCMENAMNNPKHKGVELENITVGGVWTFRYFPEITSNDRKQCEAYTEFAECVRGCLVRVIEPNATQFTRKECRDECFDECGEERDIDDHYFNPFCMINCNKGHCKQGCQTYNDIVWSSNVSGTPPSPTLHPQLTEWHTTGEVITSISESITNNTNGHTVGMHPVGIIYHVVDQLTGFTKYFDMASPNDSLHLEDFACRKVSISFVMVNKFGASLESPPLNITVPGGEILVRKPENLQVELQPDRRPGFFGYVIVNLTWNKPEDFFEGLHHYIVTIHGYTNTYYRPDSFISDPMTNTSLTVYDKKGGRLLVYGAQVLFQVCTRFTTKFNTTEECAEILSFNIKQLNELLGRNPVEITDCIAEWTGSDYAFTLYWTIPQFVAYGDEIFTSFHVSVEERLTKRFVNSDGVPKIANQTNYSYTLREMKPLGSQQHYVFRISPQWMDSDIYEKPRIEDATCTEQAVPPPSSPVLNVTLSDFYFCGDSVQFKFQWVQPTTPNDRIVGYTACLGGHRLPDFEENPGTTVDGNDTTCVQIQSKERVHSWNNKAPRPDCIYFQIRANTELGRGGEWSSTIVISNQAISIRNTCQNKETNNIQDQEEDESSKSGGFYISHSIAALLSSIILLSALT